MLLISSVLRSSGEVDVNAPSFILCVYQCFISCHVSSEPPAFVELQLTSMAWLWVWCQHATHVSFPARVADCFVISCDSGMRKQTRMWQGWFGRHSSHGETMDG